MYFIEEIRYFIDGIFYSKFLRAKTSESAIDLS